MVRVAPLDDFTWTGDPNGDLVGACSVMVRQWAGSLQRLTHSSAYRLELGEHADRCEVAAVMALPSRSVRVEASLMVPWINHRGPHSIEQLRAIRLTEPRLRLPVSKCLVTCWLDLALLPTEFEAAQRKGPLPEDLTELPAEVLATPAASPSKGAPKGKNGKKTGSSSTSIPGAAAETRSTAQRNLTSVEPVDLTASPPPQQEQPPQLPQQHQPVVAVPIAPFSLPMAGAPALPAPASPVRPERPHSVASAATSGRTPRGSPAKSTAGSAASTPTRAGPATR